MIFSSEQNRKTYRMDSTFEMTQKHCLPLHMESGVPTIADIQPRFWTQRRTSHCFQLGHHFVCLFPNAMKTFYQVHDIFSSTAAPPPPSHPKKNYLGYFEFRGMNSTEIYPILVYAFVLHKKPWSAFNIYHNTSMYRDWCLSQLRYSVLCLHLEANSLLQVSSIS